MTITKMLVKNYKLLKDVIIDYNPEINIFVGDNDAGKSTILEALSIITTGKLNGFSFEQQLKASIFNQEVRKRYISDVKARRNSEPPRILIEIYFDGDSQYKGKNNELSEDTSGVRAVVEIHEKNEEIYKRMLKEGEVKDIPVELYGVSYNYFSGEPVFFRYSPFKCVFIDTTKKGYGGLVDQFISDSISDNLTEEELVKLAVAYKASRNHFHEHEVVKKLNETVKSQSVVKEKRVSLDLKEDVADAWKKQMTVIVDDIPFESIGYGTQNSIKIQLALRNAEEQINVVLMEEPENNLAFSNMSYLVKHILESAGKQVFISTHSSYIANKLDLGNVILVENGLVRSYKELPEETKKYFIKLPGYDTLRFVLSSKVILVEGPTDDLIIQRAYKDRYGHLPADDGIDIIAVRSLAFKRFADIANLINKDIVVVTDNDGDVESKIVTRYEGYIDKENIHFFYETNNALHTIEPSVLSANCDKGQPNDSFKKVISKNGSLESRDYSGILKFMMDNKSEWAFRVFDSNEKINYPKYINEVIDYIA